MIRVNNGTGRFCRVGTVHLMSEASSSKTPEASERQRGFAARFDDMSLWDLVQFECLRRRPERALRVNSQGQVGFMYFRDGNVVHASTLRATGEPAIREMLGWTTGTVEPWPARWPERETISAPWQSLLLEAAHAADKVDGKSPGAAQGKSGASGASPPPRIERATSPPAVPRTIEKVALAPNGRVLMGGSVAGLPEAACYAAQMADLMGEFLGLEGFRTLEAHVGSEHLMIARGRDGGLAAQRARAGRPQKVGNA
jgi:Domain of unknown function (DUF4388)